MRVRRSRWTATLAAAWIQCAVGGSYCFGVYSQALKSSQGFDQTALDRVAFFKDIGANVGIPSGLLASWAPAGHRRPWLVLVAAAIQSFVGYLPIWLAVSGRIEHVSAYWICICMLIAAQSQTFFNTADVVTAVENFPDRRGTVIGIMKGFLGLSGAILVQTHRTFFDAKPSSFILVLAILPSSLALLLMYFVDIFPTNKSDRSKCDKKFLDAFSLVALCLAGYLMLVIISESVITKMPLVAQYVIFGGLMMFVLSLVFIVVKAERDDDKVFDEMTSGDERLALIETEKQDTQTSDQPSNLETLTLNPNLNLNLIQAMGKLDFWLLFLAMSCGMGSGLATVNNVSQIGSSLNYSASESQTLISLWSIWNFLGRFSSGYISDYFLNSNSTPRPLFISLTLLIMSIGHVIISLGFKECLYIGSILVGLCYGAQWSLMPSITSEIFGLEHFGTIFNAVAVASPVGSYLLSVRVVGYFYDLEARGEESCFGRNCFGMSFGIMAAVCAVGSGLGFALFWRCRGFYREVVVARLRG
ncbi:hypothetical protein LUZ60_005185 [Juncus effusus]|nr:hypothetical protein LUZ60_005185 [Juncus effusus]